MLVSYHARIARCSSVHVPHNAGSSDVAACACSLSAFAPGRHTPAHSTCAANHTSPYHMHDATCTRLPRAPASTHTPSNQAPHNADLPPPAAAPSSFLHAPRPLRRASFSSCLSSASYAFACWSAGIASIGVASRFLGRPHWSSSSSNRSTVGRGDASEKLCARRAVCSSAVAVGVRVDALGVREGASRWIVIGVCGHTRAHTRATSSTAWAGNACARAHTPWA